MTRAVLPPPDPTTPVYFVESGLRKVAPYSCVRSPRKIRRKLTRMPSFSFSSYAKKRWQGRSLLDVYALLQSLFPALADLHSFFRHSYSKEFRSVRVHGHGIFVLIV